MSDPSPSSPHSLITLEQDRTQQVERVVAQIREEREQKILRAAGTGLLLVMAGVLGYAWGSQPAVDEEAPGDEDDLRDGARR